MKSILSLLTIITLVSLASSQFIATSYGYEYVLSTTLQKFQNLLDEKLADIIKKVAVPDFTFEGFSIKNFQLQKTSINVLSSYVNLRTGKIILSPNKVGFTYTFNCSKGTENFEGEFELTIFDTQFTLKYDVASKGTTARCVVNTREKDFNVYGIDQYKAEVKTGLINKLKELKLRDTVLDDLNKNLKDYYINVYHDKIPDYTLTLSSAFQGVQPIKIDMKSYYGPCEEASNYDSALCFFPGNIETVSNLTAYRNDYQAESTFTVWEKNFKSYISYEIFKQAIAKIKGAKMILDKASQTVKDLTLDFTGKTLKTIFAGVTVDDAAAIKIESVVDDITFNDHKGTVKLTSTVYGNEASLFKFSSEINYEESLKKMAVSFDLCFKKSTLGTYKITEGEGITINKEPFESNYNKILDYSVGKTCMTDRGITTRDYYRYIEDIKESTKGIFITGQKLYGY